MRWARVPHDESLFGGDQFMWSLVAGAQGLVAVGYQNGGIGTANGEHAVAWTSSDGLHWSRLALTKARRTLLWSVDARGATFMAVGSEITADSDVAVLTSGDGERWLRVRAGEAVFGGPGNQVAKSVALGDERVVVVGADYLNGPRPAAWSAVQAGGSSHKP